MYRPQETDMSVSQDALMVEEMIREAQVKLFLSFGNVYRNENGVFLTPMDEFNVLCRMHGLSFLPAKPMANLLRKWQSIIGNQQSILRGKGKRKHGWHRV